MYFEYAFAGAVMRIFANKEGGSVIQRYSGAVCNFFAEVRQVLLPALVRVRPLRREQNRPAAPSGFLEPFVPFA